MVGYVVYEGALSHIRNSNDGYVQRSLLLLRVAASLLGVVSKYGRWCGFSLFTMYLCSSG